MDAKTIFEKLQKGRAELKAWLDGKGGAEKLVAADLDEFNNRNDELNTLGKQHDVAVAAERHAKAFEDGNKPDTDAAPYDGGEGGRKAEHKSIGQRFVESEQYKRHSTGEVKAVDLPDIELKTLMTTSANGYPPEVTRNGDIVPLPHRPLMVADLLNVRQTDQNSVAYMAQTVFTNNAAERAEGGALAESVLTWAESTSPVRSIGHFIPITDEELEDVSGIQGLVDQELAYGVMNKLDSQILVGTGAGVTLVGLLSGANTQAKGADPVFDAIGKGISTIQSSEYVGATALVIHPTNFWTMRLTRTADGVYIMGNPSEAGPTRLFGAPIVVTSAITLNTALVGDFTTGAYLANRRGMTIEVGYISDDFQKLRKSIRATIRVALPIRRPLMFTKVTGLS